MYRPKGWENPYVGEINTPWVNALEATAYEAGADAMLEELMKKSTKIDTAKEIGYLFDTIPVGVKGYLVFIPEEEE